MVEVVSLATSMLTLFRNSRPYRIAGVFTLIAASYFAYVSLYQSQASVDHQSVRKTKLFWKSAGSERSSVPILDNYYSDNAAQFNRDAESHTDKKHSTDISDSSSTASEKGNANHVFVESQVTGRIFYLDNVTAHRHPPITPVKCKSDFSLSDILKVQPIKFLPSYKNPCWEEPINGHISSLYKTNGFLQYSVSYKRVFKKLRGIYRSQDSYRPIRIRCLPYFFISGQPKCGSTDLYNKLISHPHIAVPPTKESHWWGKNRYGWCLNYTRPIPFADYVDLYDHASIEIQSITENSRERGQDFHPVITGDASVSTLWSNDDWWTNPENCGLTEPLYTNAHYVHNILPHARIIVILRNPTDRIYSDYLYFRDSKSTTDFHDVVEFATQNLNECFASMGIRSCVYNASIAYGSRLRLRIGLYHVFLQEWLSVFPKEQILVLRLEDYAAKPLKTMKRVHKFLGLKELSEEQHEQVMNQPKSNTRRVGDRRLGSMMDETRELLDKFYRPFNVKLARLMNDPAFLWEKR